MAELAGQDLVDGDSSPQVGCAFLQADSSEEGAASACVIAGPIGASLSRAVIQPTQDLDEFPARL